VSQLLELWWKRNKPGELQNTTVQPSDRDQKRHVVSPEYLCVQFTNPFCADTWSRSNCWELAGFTVWDSLLVAEVKSAGYWGYYNFGANLFNSGPNDGGVGKW